MVWSPGSTSNEREHSTWFFGDGDWPTHWKVTPSSRIPGMMMHQLNGYLGTWWVLGCHDSMIIDFSSHEYSESTSGPMMLLSWDAKKHFLGTPQWSWEIRFFHEHWLCRCSNSMERRLAYAKPSSGVSTMMPTVANRWRNSTNGYHQYAASEIHLLSGWFILLSRRYVERPWCSSVP